MATALSNQITKQIGECLVAAELGRIGLVAATFSGNIPEYDIIATDSDFRSVPVQVKATNGNSWQFNDMRRFVAIQLDGEKPIVGQPVALPDSIVCVMLALSRYGEDRFYVLSLTALQALLIKHYQPSSILFTMPSNRRSLLPSRMPGFQNSWASAAWSSMPPAPESLVAILTGQLKEVESFPGVQRAPCARSFNSRN